MVEERYELQEIFEDGFFYWYLKDNDTKLLKPIVDLHNCVKLLNQQDARIKELEEQNKNLEYARQLSYKSLLGVEDDYQDLKQENKQLKQQLSDEEKAHDLCIDRFNEECEKLRKQIKFESDARERFKQSQNQKAIEVLEKVRQLFMNGIDNLFTRNYVCNIVEIQVEKLKEENKEQCNNQYFDKIQYLKNFTQDFVRMLQVHLELVTVGSVAYFMADKDDVIDSLDECIKMYEEKEK